MNTTLNTALTQTITATLTQSENYVETLRIQSLPVLAGQFEWLVESQLLSAKAPEKRHRRHQLIVDRAALLALRTTLAALLDGTEEPIQGPEDGER